MVDATETHLESDGRRWRRTDPRIPESLETQLVKTLMAARRGVKDGLRQDDDRAVAAARRAVNDAKVALGERGDPWWETPTDSGLRDRIAAACATLLRGRDDASTICPSEIARVVDGDDWRDRMPLVRAVVADLCEEGVVVVRKKGEAVAVDADGPIRIGRGPGFES